VTPFRPRARARAIGAGRSRRLLSLRDTARAMSQENVERIRNAFAGTTAGDFSYLPGLIDENCEFRLPPDFPGTQEIGRAHV